MLFALGAASSALDAIRSLTSSNVSSGQAAGGFSEASDLFDVTSSATPLGSSASASVSNGYSQLSPETMSALLAAQGQSSSMGATTSTSASPSGALQDLFSQLDANGDGAISKTEFENALGAGGTNIAQADKVFSQLDTNGDGSVSLSELKSALQGAGGKGGHHHHAHAAGSGDSGDATSADGTSPTTGTSGSGSNSSSSDPLLQALAGATSSSVTNSDGSTTTSITNADGSKITMTLPATTTSSGSATASYNFLEQMIQREAQSISSGATSSLSLNV